MFVLLEVFLFTCKKRKISLQSSSQSPRYTYPAAERATKYSRKKRSAMTRFLAFRFYCACHGGTLHPRVSRFPFRWIRVTRALGTRLISLRADFPCSPLSNRETFAITPHARLSVTDSYNLRTKLVKIMQQLYFTFYDIVP